MECIHTVIFIEIHFSKMQNKCNTVYRFEKERLTSERDQIAIMNDNFRKIRAALTSRHQIPLQTLKIFLNPNWHERGYFYPVVKDTAFISLSFLDQILSAVNLIPCQAHLVL